MTSRFLRWKDVALERSDGFMTLTFYGIDAAGVPPDVRSSTRKVPGATSLECELGAVDPDGADGPVVGEDDTRDVGFGGFRIAAVARNHTRRIADDRSRVGADVRRLEIFLRREVRDAARHAPPIPLGKRY